MQRSRSSGPERPNRGPAAGPQNRRALIAAARVEFTEGGASVPLSRIAKRAGVGQGSLYRHFQDRTDLAAAVFTENLAEIRRRVRGSERPYCALMDAVEAQAAEAAVIIDVLAQADQSHPGAAGLLALLRDLMDEVHEAALAASELPDDVRVEDLVLAVQMLALTLAGTPSSERDKTGIRIRSMLDAWFTKNRAPR